MRRAISDHRNASDAHSGPIQPAFAVLVEIGGQLVEIAAANARATISSFVSRMLLCRRSSFAGSLERLGLRHRQT
jgi:hypothetical protein